jgi:hypothetical protein
LRISPVDAAAHVLMHLRDAWNHLEAAGDPGLRLEEQSIILTVPASFDEEARELTVDAARAAGLTHLTLLEEPIAAVYAWMSTHPCELPRALGDGRLLLVCDVGGGTTDFSLIRTNEDADGVHFERVAIGEHLLLGGDNVDVALAGLVERKIVDRGERLNLTQRQILRRQCSAAKEQVLGPAAPDRVVITILGAGRGVVAGAMTTELTREEVMSMLDTFLPPVGREQRPQRHVRPALRELGLPYESDPAITRHLAAFLARSAHMVSGSARVEPGDVVRPDAILFNGGFFTPGPARERILEACESWFGTRPAVLANDAPQAAGGDWGRILRRRSTRRRRRVEPADSWRQPALVLRRDRRCRRTERDHRRMRAPARHSGRYASRARSRVHGDCEPTGGVHTTQLEGTDGRGELDRDVYDG